MLDTLVVDFPTVPRYRQSLARACNSLGLIELGSGRLADAEAHLRRELPLGRTARSGLSRSARAPPGARPNSDQPRQCVAGRKPHEDAEPILAARLM